MTRCRSMWFGATLTVFFLGAASTARADVVLPPPDAGSPDATADLPNTAPRHGGFLGCGTAAPAAADLGVAVTLLALGAAFVWRRRP